MKLNYLTVLSDEEIEKIHYASLNVLASIGIKVDSEQATKLLLDQGASVDPQYKLVKLPIELINKTLKRVPKSFSLSGPDGSVKINIGLDNSVFATQGAPTKIYDSSHPNVPKDASFIDYSNFLKVVDSLKYITNCHLDLMPNDVPYSNLHCNAIIEWLKYCKKPFGIGCRGKLMSQDVMELLKMIVGNEKKLIEHPRIIGFFNPTSPLHLPKILLDGLFIFAKYKQPVIIAPAATGGLTAPVTLAGLLVQTNAEVLATLVLTQLINPGAPILYGGVNSPMDPFTGNPAWGAQETGLLSIALAQLARFYKIPSRASGCLTNSNILDIQNGMERYLTLSAVVNSGVNYITCVGTYECGLATSLELLLFDDELVGTLLRGKEGIDVNDETLAVNQIKDIMLATPQKSFMTLRYTSKRARQELFIPKLFDRRSREVWLKEGAKTIMDTAVDRVNQIITKHQGYPIEPDLKKDLQVYLKKVQERNIDEYNE